MAGVVDDIHYRKLEQLYAAAPVTRWYGSAVHISDGAADVRIGIRSDFHHAASAVHGSVYFRALDDAAFFAASSKVADVLMLTVSFTVHFIAPVREGELRALGRVVHAGGRLIMAEAELRDDGGRLLATGMGTFTRTAIPLNAEVGYTEPTPIADSTSSP
jgi:uncharacterized protein (TIGR00369 family)